MSNCCAGHAARGVHDAVCKHAKLREPVAIVPRPLTVAIKHALKLPIRTVALVPMPDGSKKSVMVVLA